MTTFDFRYSEYLQACNRLFVAPPTFKHLFGVRIDAQTFSNQVSADLENEPWNLTFFAQSASTPELTLSTITRTFQGVEMRFPGISDFGEKKLTLTVYDTQDRFLYRAFTAWRNSIVNVDFGDVNVGQLNLDNITTTDRMFIQARSSDGNHAPAWCLYGAFPIKITDVTGLNQEELTDIKTFSVDIKYRFAGFSLVSGQTSSFVPPVAGTWQDA